MSEKKYHYYYIYKTTNLINGKYYYGMHCTDNLNDGYIGSGTILKRSINKHGKENFKTEILEFLPSKEMLIKREKDIINEEVLNDPNSMNLQHGGGGGLSTDEHRKKFHAAGGRSVWMMFHDIHRERMKTDMEYREKVLIKIRPNLDWTGKKHNEETKKKMSDLKKGTCYGENNTQFGTCWITDGIDSKKIKKDDVLPEGWKLGRKMKK
jgi:hypothetical protein